MTVNEKDNTIYWNFPDQLLCRDGIRKEVTYTVTEEPVEGYTTKIEHHENDGYHRYTITNTKLSDLKITKKWDDDNDRDHLRPDSVQVQLQVLADSANGGTEWLPSGEPVTVKASDGWTYTFKNLPLYDKDGEEISYSASEVDVPRGYSCLAMSQASGNGPISGVIFTNIRNIDIAGAKVWNDDNNQSGNRPASITLNLLADGKIVDYKTVKASDAASGGNIWFWSFPDQPVYRDGEKVTYTVEEAPVKGYTTKMEGNAEDGFRITNALDAALQKIDIAGAKVWRDYNNKWR